jgi:hypothetical protein
LKSMRASFILGQFCYLRLLSIHYPHPLILKKFWFALSNSLHPFVNECSKETHTKMYSVNRVCVRNLGSYLFEIWIQGLDLQQALRCKLQW